MIGLLEAHEIAKMECIVNRVRPEMVRRGNMMSVDDVIDILALPLLGAVPDDENVVIATNQGEPLVGTATMAGRAYRNICARLVGEDVPLLNFDSGRHVLSKLSGVFRKSQGAKL